MAAAAAIFFSLSAGLAAGKEDYMGFLRILKINEQTRAPDFTLPSVTLRVTWPDRQGEGKQETADVQTSDDESGETKVTGTWNKIVKWALQKWGYRETVAGIEGLEKISLKDYRGSVVFLNFWATWCFPCLEEMPDMEKLYRRLKGTNFAMLAVSTDRSGSKAVRPYMQERGLTFPALLDPDRSVSRRYSVTSIPTTFLIDCQGHLVGKAIGAREWDAEGAAKLIKSLQAGPQCKG